jgi:hypothetical protein
MALWLFGWGVTVYVLIMLPVLVMLFCAERHAASIAAVAVAPATAPGMGGARTGAV